MKILILISELDMGGAETHVEALCYGLVRSGVEVTVASGGGRVADRMIKNGIKHKLIKRPERSPRALLALCHDIYEIIKEERPDAVHAHTRLTAFASHPVCRAMKIPLLTTAHALFSMRPAMARLSRWGEATVAVSEDVKDHLVLHGGVPRERIRVIENGVFVPPGIKKKGHGREILFVSRMDSDCSLGACLLCEIAPALAEKYPDVKITLVGGGDALSTVREAVEVANERSGRRVVSAVGGTDDPAHFYERASLFVGVSRAALEAMAYGTPAVLLGNEGFLGLLDESNLSLAKATNFCARGQEKATANALLPEIERFFAIPEERRAELSFFCRETVKKYYSAELMAQKTLDFYEEAIEKYRVTMRKAQKKNKEKTTRTQRKKRILLCGYYGFGNLGDDAILASVRRELAPLADTVELCVLGSKDLQNLTENGNSTHSRVQKTKKKGGEIKDKTTQNHSPRATERTQCERLLQDDHTPHILPCRFADMHSPAAVLREMRRADIFVFGGGSLLQNKTSERSLRYYLFLIDLAKRFCRGRVMLSNGIGPINDTHRRRAVFAAVNSFDKISVRDTRSQGALARALPKREISLFPDPALLLVKNTVNGNGYSESTAESFIDKEKIHEKNPKTRPENSKSPVKRTLAICLCGGELKRLGITADAVGRALRAAMQALCAEPLFIVMNERADLSVTKQVASLLDKHVLKSAPRAAEFDTRVFCPRDADELLDLLERADLSVSMRYHGALLSLGAGIPTLAVGSDCKLVALCTDVGAYPAAPAALFRDTDGLASALCEALAHFEENGGKIAENLQEMRSLCSKSFKELINYINTLDFEV